MNNFNNLITSEFKNIFNDAIDALLADNALTVQCRLKYALSEPTLCNNCIYDPISRLSSNIYNGSGPSAFADGQICPVCLGKGTLLISNEELLYMAVIFDSKYWLNWGSDTVEVPTGQVQTLCSIDYFTKIINTQEIVFDTSLLPQLGAKPYERNGEPRPYGLGSNRYISTMWKLK
jgi:hypothetical protein